MNWAWAAGSLHGNLPASDSQAAIAWSILLFDHVALADLDSSSGTRASSGF